MAINAISDLTGSAPSTPAAVSPSAPLAASEDSAVSPGGPSNVPEQVQLVLRGLSSGQIPGAYVPKGAKPVESGLKPDDLYSAGISVYRPTNEDIVAVAFNPKTISEKALKAMDKEGTISDNFPNMVDLLAGATGAESPAAGPLDGLVPPMKDGAPNEARRSQVMPRPTFGGAAASRATNERLSALTTEPSKRQIPGGGSVLNSLIARPV